jgi:hypothetical protein
VALVAVVVAAGAVVVAAGAVVAAAAVVVVVVVVAAVAALASASALEEAAALGRESGSSPSAREAVAGSARARYWLRTGSRPRIRARRRSRMRGAQ